MNKGEQVVLKSGGPIMTVDLGSADTMSGKNECVYFHDGKLVTVSLSDEALEIYKGD